MTKETIQKTNPDKIDSILSDYILHDKLHQAVMISAPWELGRPGIYRRSLFLLSNHSIKRPGGYLCIPVWHYKFQGIG